MHPQLASFESTLWVIISVIAFIYIAGPVIIKFTHVSPARMTFERFDPNTLAPDVAPFFLTTIQWMTSQGFTLIDYLVRPNAQPNVTPCAVWLVNHNTGDTAVIACFFVNQNGVMSIKNQYYYYTTRFDDTSAVATSNLSYEGPSSFKSRPDSPGFRMPTLPDPAAVYAVHRFAADKYGTGKTRVRIAPGQEMAAFDASNTESYVNQEKLGLMRYIPARDAYITTWYGAFYMTYAILWPFKSMRAAAAKQRSEALLREFQQRTA